MGLLRYIGYGLDYIKGRLSVKICLSVGVFSFLIISLFSYLHIRDHSKITMERIKRDSLILISMAKIAIEHETHGFNAISIQEKIDNLMKEGGISYLRIFAHNGMIRLSTSNQEIGLKVDKDSGSCLPCHAGSKPSVSFNNKERFRIIISEGGTRVLNTMDVIYNERRCSSASCHIHPQEKKVLGIVELGWSLSEADSNIKAITWKIILLGLILFVVLIGIVGFFIAVFVNRPVNDLLSGMRKLTRGDYDHSFHIEKDELGELTEAFTDMAREIKIRTQELERSKKEYKELFERVPCLITVIDRQYRIVQANGYFTETFGNRIGAYCYEAYKGRSQKCKSCCAEMTFIDGLVHMSEEIGLNKERKKTDYIVYTAPIVDDEGRISHVIEMSVDITQTKDLERKLRVSQEFQENLIQNSIHGIVATDKNGKIIIFNKAAEELLKYDHSEIIGTHDLERVFPREFCKKIIQSIDRKEIEETGRPVDMETFIRSKDGEPIPVRFSGVILFEGKEPIGSVGFFMDLRRIKALEREKFQAERLAIVGQTVAGLAHGVKNILTGLEGGVFVVNTGFKRKDDALVKKGWDMLIRNTQKISTLVQDLLNYSKYRTPQYEKVDPNELMKEVFELFSERAKRDGIIIEMDLQEGIGEVFLDPKGIHTCLTNLVTNALDACKMKLNHSVKKVILRTYKEKGWGVVFEVKDNGVGMDEEIKGKIFQSFFSTKGTSGTGLGLLITHKIVMEHNGEIHFESIPGEGSTFLIKLPEMGEAPPRILF
jgi:histidine kinase